MRDMKISKKKEHGQKKQRLLIEPPEEEEATGSYSQVSNSCVSQHKQLMCDNNRYLIDNYSNQQDEMLTTTTTTPTNVISSSSSNMSVRKQQQTSGSHNGRKQKDGQLSSLLMILFGSIILVFAWPPLATKLVHSYQLPLPEANASLFNENSTMIPQASPLLSSAPIDTTTRLSVVKSPPPLSSSTTTTATSLAPQVGKDTTSNSVSNNNKTDTSLVTTTISSSLLETTTPISSDINETAATVGESNTTTTTTTTTVAGESDIETESDIEVNGDDSTDARGSDPGSESEGKLTGLIMSTANAAADQLIGRLGGSSDSTGEHHETSDEEDETQTEPETETTTATVNTTNQQVGNIDRHDEQPVSGRRRHVVAFEGSKNNSSPAHQLAAHRLAQDKEYERELKLAMETYSRWKAAADDGIELFSRKLLPVIVEYGYDVDATTVNGLLQVFNGIRALKPWALKLLDASAKLSAGLLVGTQSDFGDYDECLNVRVDDPSGLVVENGFPVEIDESTGLPTSTLVGRYCLADVEFPKPPRKRPPPTTKEESSRNLLNGYEPIELRRPLFNFSESAAFKDTIFVETANFFHMLYVDPIRVGVCLTNKIDPDSFATVFNKLIEDFRVSIHFRQRCVTKYDKPQWSVQQQVSAYVLVVACSLVVLCTLLDVLHLKLNKLPLPKSLNSWKVSLRHSLFKYRPLFTSFSIIRNTKRLLKVTPSTTAERLSRHHHQQVMGDSQFMIPNNTTKQQVVAPSTAPSSSSSECSPSIERRRSSITSSALNLISEHSSLPLQVGHQLADKKLSPLNQTQFVSAGSTTTTESSTMADLMIQQQQNQHKKALKLGQNENNLLCLHGVRVITMTWMIVNHTYLFGGFFVLWAHRRLIDIAEWPKSISFQLVLNGWLTVETYFFLSATIIVLNVMPLMRARKFTYFTYVIHRLFRLLPAYTGLICLNFLWPLISGGPVWLVKGKSFIQTPCENYLWTNFLFINNWIWPEKQCMVHTWFLSADFQLYLLAPIVVYLLYRRPVLGHSLNIIVAIIASILSGFVIYANNLLPTVLINKLEFDYSYFATYQHMGPYCLGIFTGYMLHKRPQVRLPKHLTWLLWVLLPPLSFTTLLLTYLWNGAYDDPNLTNPSPLVSALYVAIHRTIWTSLVAWVVFACCTGRAKLLSSFLSNPIFIPLSRLSFSIYLVHLPVIMFRALNLRHTIEWTDSNILWEACGNFIMSLIAGYFVNVVFESPIINLERVVFGGGYTEHITTSNSTADSLKKAQTNSRTKFDDLRPIKENQASADGESDDSKSAQSSYDQPGSSITDQVSSELAVNNRQSAPLVPTNSSRQETWPTNRGSNEMKRNLSFRPKQNSSVEEIFGTNQMEPPQSSPSMSSTSGMSRPTGKRSTHQMAPGISRSGNSMALDKPPRRARGYSSYDEPSTVQPAAADDDDDDGGATAVLVDGLFGSIHDNIYPLSSEPQLYHQYHQQQYARAPSGRHQHHVNPMLSLETQPLSRSSQYATLARTSRFNHDQQHLSASPEYHSSRLDYPSYTGTQRPHLYQPHHRGTTLPPKSRSQFGEPTTSNPKQSVATTLVARRPSHQPSEQSINNDPFSHYKLAGHLVQHRRQGRYNTLSGTNTAREWRQQYMSVGPDDEVVNWSISSHHELPPPMKASAVSSWLLQPGSALIPRIDSSTLRKNSKRTTGTTGSIMEEETQPISHYDRGDKGAEQVKEEEEETTQGEQHQVAAL